MAEVVDRGALRLQPLLQRRDDAVAQRRDLLAGEPARRAQRMDPGAEQRLVGVDVADAGDLALIEQERLDRRAADPRERVEVRAREARARTARSPSRAAKNASRASPPSASSPVPKRRGSSKISSRPSSSAKRTRAWRGGSGGSSSSVPVMRRWSMQVDVVLELPDQVLAAPPERLDASAGHRGGQLVAGERAAPARIAHVERRQHAALHVGSQVPADRLDLGELGHAPGQTLAGDDRVQLVAARSRRCAAGPGRSASRRRGRGCCCR